MKPTIRELRNELSFQLQEFGEHQLAADIRSLKNRGIVTENYDIVCEMMATGSTLESAVEYIIESDF